jgi:MFS family permease
VSSLRYLAILRTPGVARPVLGTALASLPIGMLGLAVLLLVENRRGGFTGAGGIVALLGLGTGLGIAAQGRLMDRVGPPRVLLTAAAVQSLALLGLVAALHADAPYWLAATAAFLAGLGEPQVGGCLRALWPNLIPQHQRLAAAALSSIIFELPVLAGPLVLTAALLVVRPELAVLLAGAFFLGGATILGASRAARMWIPRPGVRGALVGGRVLIVAAMQGGVAGLLQVSCAAVTTRWAGLLYATLSVGSLLGTFVYGLRGWPGSVLRQVSVLTGVLTLMLVAAAFARSVVVLGMCVLVVGLVLGPVAVCCFVEAERSAPPGAAVTAFTTVTAVGLAAAAGGTALAGRLADTSGPAAALLTAAALAATATLTVRR